MLYRTYCSGPTEDSQISINTQIMEKESPTGNSTTTRTKIRDDATRTKTGTEVVCGYATYVAIMPSLHCSSCWTYWLWENCVVLRLIDNVREMIEPSPTRICYSYGEFQSMFNNYPQVHFHEGLPCKHDLVVSDNLQK